MATLVDHNNNPEDLRQLVEAAGRLDRLVALLVIEELERLRASVKGLEAELVRRPCRPTR